MHGSFATPHGGTQAAGVNTMIASGNAMRLEGSYNDMASAAANMGFPRIPALAAGSESNENENAALGGLIDVRPKKLHQM